MAPPAPNLPQYPPQHKQYPHTLTPSSPVQMWPTYPNHTLTIKLLLRGQACATLGGLGGILWQCPMIVRPLTPMPQTHPP